jgi:hypothetical protein
MRPGLSGTLAFLVLAASLAAGGGGAGAAVENDQAARPALRLVDQQPLTVRGVRFEAGERVRLVVTRSRERLVRQARANRTGAFLAVFPIRVRVAPCNAELGVWATGDRGSRAALRLPHVACPPQR